MSGPTRKRKEFRQPKKLTDFFTLPNIQDGAREIIQGTSAAYTDLPDAGGLEISPHPHSPDASPSSLTSSAGNSPAKSRMRLDADSAANEVSPISDHIPASPSPIAAFPTTDQPVLDTTMKEMLISLHRSLHNDISTMFTRFSSQMHCMGQKMHLVEKQMGQMTETVNDLVDAHDHTQEEQQWMRAKMADLEDRSRRNNVKLRGVPESVLPHDLNAYARKLITTILPDLTPMETIIDRIHRLPKPPHLQAEVPRDVLMRIHFFHAKDQLLLKSRHLGQLPAPYTNIQLYADLSQHTRQMRRQLNTITKPLNNHKIPYQWGFPTKIIITKNGVKHHISTIEEGLKLLNMWGIIPEPPLPAQPSRRRNTQSSDERRFGGMH